jgi:Sulfotransferase family
MPNHRDGHNLVFLVGCPRSGTTWLQRLLAAHPKIKTGQESDLFTMYIGPQLRAWRQNLDPSENSRGGLGLACYHKEARFIDILRQYLDALLEPMLSELAADELFLEKTPSHALFLGEIFELLPESRIIHMLRDPRDVVSSLLAASKASWGRSWAPQDAAQATMIWLNHVSTARAAAAGLQSGQFTETTYEALYADPSQELGGILDFLGLHWSDEELQKAIEVNSAGNMVRTGGTPIQLKGEFGVRERSFVSEPAGFIRKAKPGTWREELSLRDRVRIWRMARAQMRELGYYWQAPIV